MPQVPEPWRQLKSSLRAWRWRRHLRRRSYRSPPHQHKDHNHPGEQRYQRNNHHKKYDGCIPSRSRSRSRSRSPSVESSSTAPTLSPVLQSRKDPPVLARLLRRNLSALGESISDDDAFHTHIHHGGDVDEDVENDADDDTFRQLFEHRRSVSLTEDEEVSHRQRLPLDTFAEGLGIETEEICQLQALPLDIYREATDSETEDFNNQQPLQLDAFRDDSESLDDLFDNNDEIDNTFGDNDAWECMDLPHAEEIQQFDDDPFRLAAAMMPLDVPSPRDMSMFHVVSNLEAEWRADADDHNRRVIDTRDIDGDIDDSSTLPGIDIRNLVPLFLQGRGSHLSNVNLP